MAQVSRSYTFTDGTDAFGSEVQTEFATIYNAWNNHDSGSSNWQILSTLNASSVPLVADNSSGTQNIANFKDNGTTVLSVADGGTVTVAPGGTTKVVANSSGLTLSNSATIAMGSAKITGLAAATANGEAVRFEQLYYGFQAPVQKTATSTVSTTETSYQVAISQTFTPTSSSHRVKLTCATLIQTSGGSVPIVSFFRDATDLDAGSGGFSTFTAASVSAPMCITYIDSPATTSQVTYSVKFKSSAGGSVGFGGGCMQVLTIEEIV